MKPSEIEINQNKLNAQTKNGKDVVFAAVSNGKIVGLCKAGIITEKKEGAILTINVFDKSQKKGIGYKLIGKAHSYFESKGIKKVTVYPVHEAIGFYKKTGYEPSKRGNKRIHARISPNVRKRKI